MNNLAAKFKGADFVAERDGVRLVGQILRVFDTMKAGGWWTTAGVAASTGDPETSVSAQMRNLRKPEFGGHTVERKYVGTGLYRYRLLVNPSTNIPKE
jgi:hypothetical protein